MHLDFFFSVSWLNLIYLAMPWFTLIVTQISRSTPMLTNCHLHQSNWQVHLKDNPRHASWKPLTAFSKVVSSCWVGCDEDGRNKEAIFPVKKKWGSPITQDTTCLMTALLLYWLLMRLSLGKIAISVSSVMDLSLNAEHGNGQKSFLLILSGWKQTLVRFGNSVFDTADKDFPGI